MNPEDLPHSDPRYWEAVRAYPERRFPLATIVVGSLVLMAVGFALFIYGATR